MPDSYMVITEKDWDEMSPKQQGWLLFNTMQNMNKRLKRVERRPIIDKVLGFGGGVIGGALAALGFNLK
jgi:hypothetical protein